MEKYRERIADRLLEKKLKSKGAVLIEGPKWCGKTTTAEHRAGSVVYLSDPLNGEQNLSLAEMNPTLLLEGETPRLLDEWQIAPKLWDAVRFAVDHRGERGQFILTGSATPADRGSIHHSGTGRFAWLQMRTMSLFESGESNGSVRLADLFAGEDIEGQSTLSFEDLAYLTVRGGWPGALDLERDIALEQAEDYFDALVRTDLSKAGEGTKNVERLRKFLRSYARHVGTQVSASEMARDVSDEGAPKMSDDTARSYLNILESVFAIEEMPAWNPNLRSKTAIRTANTRYFSDPSIAAAALGVGPQDLVGDIRTFGFLFENLCVRDIRVFADVLGGSVYHYRDKTGLECDAVVYLKNGEYGLMEITLGGDTAIREKSKNLLKLKDNINTDKMKEPSFLAVVSGTSAYAFRQENGVLIVPIGCLRD